MFASALISVGDCYCWSQMLEHQLRIGNEILACRVWEEYLFVYPLLFCFRIHTQITFTCGHDWCNAIDSERSSSCKRCPFRAYITYTTIKEYVVTPQGSMNHFKMQFFCEKLKTYLYLYHPYLFMYKRGYVCINLYTAVYVHTDRGAWDKFLLACQISVF